MGVEYVHQLAYQCWNAASENGDPWKVLSALVQNPNTLPTDLKAQIGSFADTWNYLTSECNPRRLALAKVLGRLDIDNEQAERWWDQSARNRFELSIGDEQVTDHEILKNPYLIYECDRLQSAPIAFRTINQGIFPDRAVASAHALPDPSAMNGPVDGRRLRAATAAILEDAAEEGHTLLAREEIIAKIRERNLSPALPAIDDLYEIHRNRLSPFFVSCMLEDGKPSYQLDRLDVTRDVIATTVCKRVGKGKRLTVDIDWRGLLDHEFEDVPAPKKSLEDQGRIEKAAALRELTAARFSILIGAAGTGKTTLLKFLCNAPGIKERGVLLLTPTGKARVRLQRVTGMGASTIAQFLLPIRYNGTTNRYRVVGNKERSSAYKTVIVDEASMLTEVQLAAVIDALDAVDRILLVGDPSQLPPIGPGRPFVDITKLLTPTNFRAGEPHIADGYAELTIGSRQKGSGRRDLEYAEQFSGRAAGAANDEIIGLLGQEDCGPHLRICSWSSPKELVKLLPQVIAENSSWIKIASNLYFWRDRTGHEVDLLVDHGTDLSAMEIKSGQTINGDYFRGLEFWRNLAGEAAGQSWLVYGGDNRQVRSNVTVLPWHEMLPEQVVNEHNAHA